jgi:hypothetical protein
MRVLVFGSPGYDDELSLRAALDELFDKAPMNGDLVVLAGREGCEGPEAIARSWAQEMIADKMPVLLEDRPEIPEATFAEGCLVAIRTGDPMLDPASRRELTELARILMARGLRVRVVVQGHAQGLPEDLAGGPGGRVLGTVTRRSGMNRGNDASPGRPGSKPPHHGR